MKQDFLDGLPKKRGGAGSLFFNEQQEVLLLKTKYKDNWEIPGGIIEDNESPEECMRREVQEELGYRCNSSKLLCLEYQRYGDDESYMFVYDGGIVSSTDIESFSLQDDEISGYGFYKLSDMSDKLLPKMYTRIEKAIEAKTQGTTIYYETCKDA